MATGKDEATIFVGGDTVTLTFAGQTGQINMKPSEAVDGATIVMNETALGGATHAIVTALSPNKEDLNKTETTGGGAPVSAFSSDSTMSFDIPELQTSQSVVVDFAPAVALLAGETITISAAIFGVSKAPKSA